MKENNYFELVIDGKPIKYEIIMAFKWLQNNKNYIVYTDNTKDEDNKLKIYAGAFYPENKHKFDTVLEDYEWEEIDKRIKSMGNDKDEE